MVSFAVLFPGQGSQFVGMGETLFDERPDLLGERSDEILGWSLREMCLHRPEDQLTRTEHAQPALFAVAYTLWDTFAGDLPELPAAAAGHSLGEYTALTAAGAFDYDTALGLVAERGRAMASASDIEPSGMAALIGADEDLAESISRRRREMGGRLEVANINAPGQVVVAGGEADIDWLVSSQADLGVRRVVALNVAGAFHSSFMEPASAKVAEALEQAEIMEPRFPVWSNTTARPHRRGEIADLLTRQVITTVRFSESLEDMAQQGIKTFIHVGPGDVTAGMAKRTVDDGETLTVSDISGIRPAVEALSTMS
jgi:[acyl-carrier-protein] S-malonyltransferase